MIKDSNETLLKATKKAPHGFAFCQSCKHPNIHVTADGLFADHWFDSLGFCKGSGTPAPSRFNPLPPFVPQKPEEPVPVDAETRKERLACLRKEIRLAVSSALLAARVAASSQEFNALMSLATELDAKADGIAALSKIER